MLSFHLDAANVVIRGRFNPYIFSPQWLKQEGVWTPQKFQLMLGIPGDGVGFRDAESRTEWSIESNGMTIASIENAGKLAGKILELLPHTPVSAVGCNFTFVSKEAGAELLPKLGDIDLEQISTEFKLEMRIWKGVFHIDDTQVLMEVVHGDKGVTIEFNHHHPVSNAKEAKCIAETFHDYKLRSRKMISQILKGNVT